LLAALAVLLPAIRLPPSAAAWGAPWGLYLLALAGALACRAFERRFE